MNCHEARKLTHLFVDGALDPRANVDVLAHLNMCPPCNAKFEDAKKFEEFLKDKLKPGVAPEAVKARIHCCLAEMVAPWPVRAAGALRRKPLLPVAGLAAVAAISFTAWHSYGAMATCPFVRGATMGANLIDEGQAPAMSKNPEGGLRQINENVGNARAFEGLHHNGRWLADVNGKVAVADTYYMDHCPNDSHCVILFFVDAPALTMYDHDCVVKQGRKFSCWEYDDRRVVCWKDEKHGMYCMMVCRKKEMEHEALVSFASAAAAQ